MNAPEPQRPRLAGGIFIALGLLVGTIFGLFYGQSSVGMIAGLAVGSAIALFIWFIDRRRS